MYKIIRIHDHILDIMSYLAGVIVIFIMLAISAEITVRYILGRDPLSWAFELSEYAILYICFLVCAWVLRSEGHVWIGLLTDSLKPRHQAIIKIFQFIVIASTSLILLWYSAKATWEHLGLGLYKFGGLEIPTGFILLVIPIGTFFLFIESLRRIYSNVVAYKKEGIVETE